MVEKPYWANEVSSGGKWTNEGTINKKWVYYNQIYKSVTFPLLTSLKDI